MQSLAISDDRTREESAAGQGGLWVGQHLQVEASKHADACATQRGSGQGRCSKKKRDLGQPVDAARFARPRTPGSDARDYPYATCPQWYWEKCSD